MTGRANLWLLLLVAVCAASFWFGKDLIPKRDGSESGSQRPSGTPVSYSMPEEEAPVHLAVLNGTDQAGLARKISLLLGKAGCVAESVGNAQHRRYEHSILVNRRLTDDQAARLAERLGGIRVVREWDRRSSEDAVLVLGGDYADLEAGLERTGSPDGG